MLDDNKDDTKYWENVKRGREEWQDVETEEIVSWDDKKWVVQKERRSLKETSVSL